MNDDLWFFLADETFHQRGEGFQRDSSFHLLAAKLCLGAPLAHSLPFSQQVLIGKQTYSYQPFAKDLLYNPSTLWSEVHSLNADLQGKIPATSSLSYQLLRHAYRRCIAASDSPMGGLTHIDFERDWIFHQVAIQQGLGMALSGNYTISPAPNLLVALQVFAGDTLYSTKPPFPDAHRLSDLPPEDPLYHALWFETYKVAHAVFGGEGFGFNLHFHKFALQAKLGVPLSEYYRGYCDNVPYDIQVFAHDTLYATLGGPILRWSALPLPSVVQNVTLPGITLDPAPVAGDAPPPGATNFVLPGGKVDPVPVTGDGKIPGTGLTSLWLADKPATPEPVRKLIVLALRVLSNVLDSKVLPILTAQQRTQMQGDTDITCADLVSMCLKTAGVNTTWKVTQPPGTVYKSDRAANYYRPEAMHPALYQLVDNDSWLPGDILVYKDFTQPVSGWWPGEYHHVVVYVGPYSGRDKQGRMYLASSGYSVVSSSMLDTRTNGITQANAKRPKYFGYNNMVRVRHIEIEHMYRQANMIT